MAAPMELIAQGAEGRVFKTTFGGRPCIMKERFAKKYRHPTLDANLTKQRLTQEARSILRCNKNGIRTPSVYFVDTTNNRLYIEFIDDARTVRNVLMEAGEIQSDSPLHKLLANEIGAVLARMHSVDVVHGDLTTSNMMLKGESTLVVIDFGLSFVSSLAEDKAVDLYVLERAFLSTHPKSELLFEDILKVYREKYKNSSKILKKLDEVRMRGRKRSMVG